jgi:Replication-relaxation
VTGSLAPGLTDRDRSVLRQTGVLRLATGGQLRRLVFGDPSASSHNARLARRCFERLTTAGLMVRLVRRLGGLGGGSSSFVYALTPAGARAIGLPPHRHRLDPSLTFLTHTTTISETYTQLYESLFAGELLSLDVEVEPEAWRPAGDGSGSVLKPDLFVRLETASEEVFAYVEIDLATEHAGAIRRKLALYAGYRSSGRDQSRLDLFPSVYWSVPDPARAVALRRYLEPETRRSPGLHQVVLANQLIPTLRKGGTHA